MEEYFASLLKSKALIRNAEFLRNRMVGDSSRIFQDRIDIELASWHLESNGALFLYSFSKDDS
jgi:hypothetical protein